MSRRRTAPAETVAATVDTVRRNVIVMVLAAGSGPFARSLGMAEVLTAVYFTVLNVVEEHRIAGGLGGAVAETAVRHLPCPVELVAVRDHFGESGPPAELPATWALTALMIVDRARRVLANKKHPTHRTATSHAAGQLAKRGTTP